MAKAQRDTPLLDSTRAMCCCFSKDEMPVEEVQSVVSIPHNQDVPKSLFSTNFWLVHVRSLAW